MTSDEFKVEVLGDPALIDVSALAAASRGLASILSGMGPGPWVVSTLELGSLKLGSKPGVGNDLDVDAEFNTIISGFDEVSRGHGGLGPWNISTFEGFALLGSTTHMSGVDGVRIIAGTTARMLDREFSKALSQEELNSSWSLGSVTGVIDRMTDRKTPEFGLIDEDSGRPVTVRFPRNRDQDVYSAWGKKVTVWGDLLRDSSGRKKLVKMHDFETVEVRTIPADVSEIRGLFGPEWTGGLDPVEWIRSQRGG